MPIVDYTFYEAIEAHKSYSSNSFCFFAAVMNLLRRFQQYIDQHALFHQKDKLLLAVSGGVDSVVLCELCYQAGFDFSIAHCNFQLRGKESERDATFVKRLGEKYGVEVLAKKFDTEDYARKSKKGIQE